MKKNLLILLFFAFVTQAKAGFLIEPYIGFAMNGTAENTVLNSEDDYTGTTLGGRLGWQMLGLFVAGDYRMSSLSADSADVDETLYSAVIGYEFPVMFRLYGQYILGGSAETDESPATEYEDVSGTVLGIGFTGLPFVSLNFEMADYSYGEIDGSSAYGDTDFSHYLLSVSLPLNL